MVFFYIQNTQVGRLNRPLSHLSPYVPLSQPFRQLPFMWWHCFPFRQFPHIIMHSLPYVLSLHSVPKKSQNVYIQWLCMYTRIFLWSKALLKKETYAHKLTFITIVSRVSHNTTQTRPSNDVTMSLLTVLRTRYRTAFSIKPRSWTAWKILFTWFFSTYYMHELWHKTQLFSFNFFPHTYWILRVCWNTK